MHPQRRFDKSKSPTLHTRFWTRPTGHYLYIRLTSVEQQRWFGSYPRQPVLCSPSAYVEKKAGLTCYNRPRPTPQHSTQHTCTQRTSTPPDVAWSTPSTLKKLPGLILSQPLDQPDRSSSDCRTLQGVNQSASVRNGTLRWYVYFESADHVMIMTPDFRCFIRFLY
jgi:hypothetical protein